MTTSSWLRWTRTREGVVALIVSTLLLLASAFQWLPLTLLEVLGFITGAVSIWLAAKEHVWNWPIGILNSLCFFFLFLGDVKLYGSAGIQILYIALSIYGWYKWLYGGEKKTTLQMRKLSLGILLTAIVGTVLATILMTWIFTQTSDPSPFLDAFTTALSLTAIYMLTVKIAENWYIWIATDIIFVILYMSQHFYLTGTLYIIFLFMAIYGLRDWKRKLKS